MRRPKRILQIPLDERLRDSPQFQTTLALPAAILHRLEELSSLAVATRATQSDLIGMLVAQADMNPDELEHHILEYRKKKVGDIFNPDAGTSQADVDLDLNIVKVPLRPPGRPSRR